jgi:putative solute:sodium symporter small subunit
MDDTGKAYWSAVLGLLARVLLIWFVVSFGCGILFVDALNNIKLGGYPLGFWFAHQGSIYVFIALIFYYAKAMNKIDRKFDVHE